METRNRIGLIYFFDNSWLGGLYYAQNLVIALGTLADEFRPVIDVYCHSEDEFVKLQLATKYPYLRINVVKEFKYKRILRNALFFLMKKRAYNMDMFNILPEDNIVFPYNWGSEPEKLLHWIPDFQDKYFPQYFSKLNLKRRDESIRQVCKRGVPIVFSSHDCEKDFKKFYPEFKDHETYVVHFAVNQPDFSDQSIDQLKEKFSIRGEYLLCANQFWGHKNHLFLFKSFKKALDAGWNKTLVCTGNMNGSKNVRYVEELRSFINKNGLEKKILLLGIIEKNELLCLMKNSYAVVQPSLFEGWNTTVEDCKCMNKFVFLSDLNVHREQISKNVCFFNPKDEEDLVQKFLSVKPSEEKMDYTANIKNFGLDFYSIIKNLNVKNGK